MYYNVQIYSWKLKPFLWVWDFGFYRLGLSDRWHSLRHPALPGSRVYIILQIMSSVSLYIDPVQVIIILAARSLESVLFRPLSWCSHLEFSTLTSVLPNRDWKSKMVWFLFRKMIISIHYVIRYKERDQDWDGMIKVHCVIRCIGHFGDAAFTHVPSFQSGHRWSWCKGLILG